jgi:hypothetical protein
MNWGTEDHITKLGNRGPYNKTEEQRIMLKQPGNRGSYNKTEEQRIM